MRSSACLRGGSQCSRTLTIDKSGVTKKIQAGAECQEKGRTSTSDRQVSMCKDLAVARTREPSTKYRWKSSHKPRTNGNRKISRMEFYDWKKTVNYAW